MNQKIPEIDLSQFRKLDGFEFEMSETDATWIPNLKHYQMNQVDAIRENHRELLLSIHPGRRRVNLHRHKN